MSSRCSSSIYRISQKTKMAIKERFTESVLAKYARMIRATPRGLMVNRSLLFSCAVYALAGLPTSKSKSLSYGTIKLIALKPGTKAPPLLFPPYQDSKSNSTSSLGQRQAIFRTSYPSSISAMLLAQLHHSSSTTGSVADGPSAYTLPSGSLGNWLQLFQRGGPPYTQHESFRE